MKKYIKYPRTYHLPESYNSNDDKILKSDDFFKGKKVVGTIKMDGENFTGYNDYCHARSINSNSHPSRDKAKYIWFKNSYLLKDDKRVCCENLYAKHNIYYKNLKSYLLVFSIWKKNICLSWNDTLIFSKKLGLETVDYFYIGDYNKGKIFDSYKNYKLNSKDNVEGFVLRLYDSFLYYEFYKSVAKFVEKSFKENITNEHWINKKIIPNKLFY
jgi:hypothetical protein